MSETGENKKKTVLLVEDEDHIVTYLATLLQDNGYETVAAFNGIEGMEKVKSEMPDLICLDITMPEQSGIRFYRDMKDDPRLASIPVVIVTAVTGYGGDPEPFKKFLSTRKQIPPPEAFFSKPIEEEKFLDTIAKLLS